MVFAVCVSWAPRSAACSLNPMRFLIRTGDWLEFKRARGKKRPRRDSSASSSRAPRLTLKAQASRVQVKEIEGSSQQARYCVWPPSPSPVCAARQEKNKRVSRGAGQEHERASKQASTSPPRPLSSLGSGSVRVKKREGGECKVMMTHSGDGNDGRFPAPPFPTITRNQIC